MSSPPTQGGREHPHWHHLSPVGTCYLKFFAFMLQLGKTANCESV